MSGRYRRGPTVRTGRSAVLSGLRVVKSGLGAEDQIVIDGLANPAVRPGVKVMPKPGQIQAAAQ